MGKGHKINSIEPESIAYELGIEPGDYLYSINGKEIQDIFDYHYLVHDEYLTLLIGKQNGEEWELDIEKDFDEDLGIEFEQGLMDDYKSCHNKCMFCFIDQMPPGMRETLYFKDDDARLSFLQGNYITLTNMKEEDFERILLYKLAPVNISVHTTNPELRCKMLRNRFAGTALEKMKRLYDAGLEMNSQIVLCKGYNDGAELDRTIDDLSKLLPHMRSLSVVPVGLTKYRDGLEPLEKFTKEEARKLLEQIHGWQKRFLEQYGTRFVYASDEWYLTAELPIPDEEYYEGYGQIENGVGMIRSFADEVKEELEYIQKERCSKDVMPKTISIVTGKLSEDTIREQVENIQNIYPQINAEVYAIENHFFGTDITVTGLLTGQDIIEQLKGKELGEYLLLPDVLLRNGEEVLLDDYTVKDLEKSLQIDIHIVQSNGVSFVDSVVGEE